MYRKPLETDECPKTEELEAHAAKRLIGKRNEEVFLHLRHCSRCLRRISKLTRTPSPQEIIKGGGGSSWWKRLWGRPRRPKGG